MLSVKFANSLKQILLFYLFISFYFIYLYYYYLFIVNFELFNFIAFQIKLRIFYPHHQFHSVKSFINILIGIFGNVFFSLHLKKGI